MTDSASPVLGMTYSRKEIALMVGGGSLQTYLPYQGAHILCGCFDPGINARAPFEIDVGDKPRVIQCARMLVNQGGEIPIFIKRAVNKWEYIGNYTAARYSEDKAELQAREDFRSDAIGILFLAASHLNESDIGATDLDLGEWLEGNRSLRMHLARERQPGLSAMKRTQTIRATGTLVCEVCGLDFMSPPVLRIACCEVHHLDPIGSRSDSTATRLEDLAVLCSNCHRMIHRTEPMATVSQLRAMLFPG